MLNQLWPSSSTHTQLCAKNSKVKVKLGLLPVMAATSVKDNSSRKHRSARGIATMQATDTTASHVLKCGPPKLASAKDNTSSSKQSSANGATISHPLQRGLPNMDATSSKDNSSSKKRKAKGSRRSRPAPPTWRWRMTPATRPC